MVQEPTPNNPKTSVIILQWLSAILFLASAVVGIISIVAKFAVLSTVIAFVIAIVAIPISILQINKGAFSFILRDKKIGMQVFGVFLLIASLSWNVYSYFSFHNQLGNMPSTSIVAASSTPTNAPKTPTTTVVVKSTYPPNTTSTPEATSQSSLIPGDREPSVNDPLANNSQGYGWDQGANNQKTGTCDFVSGSYYQISAPAGSPGVGCNMENKKGVFSNFVYQIRMTILEGVDGDNASTCTTFRVSDTTQAQDQACFSQNGYWSVSGSSGTLSQDTSQFPYFATGVNQINYITIRASGSTFQVQVNDHDLGGTYNDPGISSGFLGVNLAPDTSESKVAFSNLRVWIL